MLTLFKVPPDACESGLILQNQGSTANLIYVKLGARDNQLVSASDYHFIVSPRGSATPNLKPDFFTNLPVGNVIVFSAAGFDFSFCAWCTFLD